jgi:hypothetical protein
MPLNPVISDNPMNKKPAKQLVARPVYADFLGGIAVMLLIGAAWPHLADAQAVWAPWARTLSSRVLWSLIAFLLLAVATLILKVASSLNSPS